MILGFFPKPSRIPEEVPEIEQSGPPRVEPRRAFGRSDRVAGPDQGLLPSSIAEGALDGSSDTVGGMFGFGVGGEAGTGSDAGAVGAGPAESFIGVPPGALEGGAPEPAGCPGPGGM
jgi:hypothetical protein